MRPSPRWAATPLSHASPSTRPTRGHRSARWARSIHHRSRSDTLVASPLRGQGFTKPCLGLRRVIRCKKLSLHVALSMLAPCTWLPLERHQLASLPNVCICESNATVLLAGCIQERRWAIRRHIVWCGIASLAVGQGGSYLNQSMGITQLVVSNGLKCTWAVMLCRPSCEDTEAYAHSKPFQFEPTICPEVNPCAKLLQRAECSEARGAVAPRQNRIVQANT